MKDSSWKSVSTSAMALPDRSLHIQLTITIRQSELLTRQVAKMEEAGVHDGDGVSS